MKDQKDIFSRAVCCLSNTTAIMEAWARYMDIGSCRFPSDWSPSSISGWTTSLTWCMPSGLLSTGELPIWESCLNFLKVCGWGDGGGRVLRGKGRSCCPRIGLPRGEEEPFLLLISVTYALHLLQLFYRLGLMETMKATMATTMGMSTAHTPESGWPDYTNPWYSELIDYVREISTHCFLCIFISTFSQLKRICIINI